jgi:hypothetical protein
MIKLKAVLASSIVVLAGWLLAMPAGANGPSCTPTGFTGDGIDLTAAQIGGTVSGPLDATGCDIGVYFPTSGSVTIGGDIFGARYFGVVNNGTSVSVTGALIHDIGDTPFDGAQHGVGIYYTNGASGAIDGNTVSQYQKGGIVVNGATNAGVPTTATVTNNTVTGLGPVLFIAQNGIQVSRGAVAEVRGNTISDNFYTGEVGVGPNAGDKNPEGWEYISAGLLLFHAGAGTMTSDNHFSGNQLNFVKVP